MKKFYAKPKERAATKTILGGIYKSNGKDHKDEPHSLFMLVMVDGGYAMITVQGSRYSTYGKSNSTTTIDADNLIKAYDLVARDLTELIETHNLI